MNIRTIISIYVLLYAVLAAGDLGSTLLGHTSGASEFNPVMQEGDRIDVGRFIWVNTLVGAVSAAMLGWALARAERADPRYVRSPWKASLSWLTYLNPFARENQPKAVFHWVAIPVSLLFVRFFAILNNLAITYDIPDVLTPIASWLDGSLPEKIVYLAVATILMAPFWIGTLYLVPLLLAASEKMRERRVVFKSP